MLIRHRLGVYNLAIAVQCFQCVLKKLHAHDRGAGPLMFAQNYRLALAVIDNLPEAVMGVGQLDRREMVVGFLRSNGCHSMSPSYANR